jgi:hypothetical protein
MMASSKRSVEKEQFWRLVLAEHATSGLSVRAFCQREAVSEPSFYFWRRELASRDSCPESHPGSIRLVPVRVVQADAPHADEERPPSEHAVIEIGMPGGFTLRAGSATDTERVAAWIAAIIKVAAT